MDDAYTKGAYTEEIYGNPNASSIYVHLRNLLSVNAHLYASSVYAHIRKRAYTKNTIIEVVSLRICIVCIRTFTETVVRICAYTKSVVRICAYMEAHI